jgi:hypothetical protein
MAKRSFAQCNTRMIALSRDVGFEAHDNGATYRNRMVGCVDDVDTSANAHISDNTVSLIRLKVYHHLPHIGEARVCVTALAVAVNRLQRLNFCAGALPLRNFHRTDKSSSMLSRRSPEDIIIASVCLLIDLFQSAPPI